MNQPTSARKIVVIKAGNIKKWATELAGYFQAVPVSIYTDSTDLERITRQVKRSELVYSGTRMYQQSNLLLNVIRDSQQTEGMIALIVFTPEAFAQFRMLIEATHDCEIVVWRNTFWECMS